jgi:WD40 repeat protein
MFSPDGKVVLIGGDEATPPKLFSAAESNPGQELAQLGSRRIWSAHFSPDGGKLLTTSRMPGSVFFQSGQKSELAEIWDVATGRLLHTLTDATGMVQSDITASWSPDGKHVLFPVAGGKTARVLDAASSDVVAEMKGHTAHITCGSYSPDGRLVATGSDDKTVRLWDAARGRELAVLEGHEHPVRTLAFRADGRLLVTTGTDRTIRLWAIPGGIELATYPGYEYGMDATFTPDGRWILASSPNECRVFPVDPLAAARNRLPRELTPAERARFEIDKVR